MSLYGILNIGGSALAAQQAALQVTGNNLANAGEPNYVEETADLSPSPDVSTSSGQLLGSGVTVDSIQRQVDLALQERLLGANSDASSTNTLENWSGQVQSVFNALSNNTLSTQLSTFFNDWSGLANNPTDTGQQSVVVQDGANVAETLNSLSSNLDTLSTQLQQSVGQQVEQVNQLTGQIASLNGQIVAAQAGGSSQANSLLDQRDADLTQLSTLTNVQTATQADGSINVYIGNEPLVQGTTAQSLSAGTITNSAGQIDSQVTFADGTVANLTSGQLGGSLQSQQFIDSTSTSLNTLSSNIISAVNNIYSSGQGTEGYTSLTATNAVSDPSQALNSPASGLNFPVQSGSFTLTETDSATGASTSTLVSINESGTSNTTLNSLAATLNGISGVSATINNGQLSIQSSNPDVTLSFSGDSSGVLSALGLNTFFTGSNATDIGVNKQLASNPAYLASAAYNSKGDLVANLNAQSIANLGTQPLSALGGASLGGSYDALVENIGTTAANANNDAATTGTVQQALSAQEQTLSGVSTDQEALNMIVEQRSYQGAAEFISTINTMMQTLLAIT